MVTAGRRRAIAVAAVAVVAALAGLGAGYALWSPPDWYADRTPDRLPPGPENDLVRYGWQIVVETPQHIGPLAADPAKRYAGNALACTNCHLDAGLKPFAAPFVSTVASYPMFADDTVVTLTERINGCLVRSLNGAEMPPEGREMQALLAYLRWLGTGTPEGVRVAGMGLMPMADPAETPDAGRGRTVYAAQCARCHGAGGEGEPNVAPAVGWSVPPLWGADSFNAEAGMAHITMAAAFIRANMPRGVKYDKPRLTPQEAWDVAAFVTSQPRPPRPGEAPVAPAE
ncbi:MAG TPA: c-type cytochrome [Bauldia sp.]|nr:c-type cytochrome [Bauldia sp.]